MSQYGVRYGGRWVGDDKEEKERGFHTVRQHHHRFIIQTDGVDPRPLLESGILSSVA